MPESEKITDRITLSEESPGTGENSAGRETGLLFVLAFVWVGIFCLPWAATMALWTDDLYSLRTAVIPVGEMLGLLREYHPWNFDQPPLYFLLLKPFTAISTHHLIIRIPSLVCLALAAGVIGRDARARGGSFAAAAIAGFVLVLHPLMRHSAVGVRMYTVVALLSCVLLSAIWRIPDSTRRWWGRKTWITAAALASLCYTSYFGFVMGAGIALLAVAWAAAPGLASSRDRMGGFRLLIGGLAALMLLAPWLPVLREVVSDRGTSIGGTADSHEEQAIALMRNLCGNWVGGVWILSGWTALLAWGHRRARWSGLVICTVIAPFILLVALTPQGRALQARYLIFALPTLLGGAVMGWDAAAGRFWTNRRARTGVVVTLGLLPAFFFDHTARSTTMKSVPDWWAAAEMIESQARPEEYILTGSHLSGDLIEYHMSQPGRLRFIHNVFELDSFYLACRDPKVVWYVSATSAPEGYEAILDRYFPYRTVFEGSQGFSAIRVFSKRPFRTTWGTDARFQEPIALEYEETLNSAAREQPPEPH